MPVSGSSIPPASASTPTATRQVVDPTGTPTQAAVDIKGTVPAEWDNQARGIIDGRYTQEFVLAEGGSEGSNAPWVVAVSEAHRIMADPTKDVIIETIVDPGGAAIRVLFPARAVRVDDGPRWYRLVYNTTEQQPAWTVGVADADTAYALIASGAGDVAQTVGWGDTSPTTATQIGLITISAATVAAEVVQSEDPVLRAQLAQGLNDLETAIVAGPQRQKTQAYRLVLPVTVAGSPVDLRVAVDAALAAGTPAQLPMDWDQGIAGLSLFAAADVTLTLNGVSSALPAGESFDAAAFSGGDSILNELTMTATTDTTVTVRLDRHVAG